MPKQSYAGASAKHINWKDRGEVCEFARLLSLGGPDMLVYHNGRSYLIIPAGPSLVRQFIELSPVALYTAGVSSFNA
jgi:hypothetical protein